MSNRKRANAPKAHGRAAERQLLAHAVDGDLEGAEMAALGCAAAMSHQELSDALGRMAWAAGVFARRLPAGARRQMVSELNNADALVALMGGDGG